jgi:hypothetical protein
MSAICYILIIFVADYIQLIIPILFFMSNVGPQEYSAGYYNASHSSMVCCRKIFKKCNIFSLASEFLCLEVNAEKTKYMVISWDFNFNLISSIAVENYNWTCQIIISHQSIT